MKSRFRSYKRPSKSRFQKQVFKFQKQRYRISKAGFESRNTNTEAGFESRNTKTKAGFGSRGKAGIRKQKQVLEAGVKQGYKNRSRF